VTGVALALLAIVAGIVSATSPCVLPVIPGFLAAVSPQPELSGKDGWRPSRTGALSFVAGFTTVFTLLGATASLVGAALYAHLDGALRIAGVALIVLGVSSAGVIKIPLLNTERRVVALDRVAGGPRRAFALGLAFALGWTPCVGPVLAAILTRAAADATLLQGVVLLILYSAGLGLPFIAVTLWFERSRRPRLWLARRSATVQRLGGLVMVIAGIGYLTGSWTLLFAGLQRWLAQTGWPPI
jgi:cytochrome c-type biogenesis protein